MDYSGECQVNLESLNDMSSKLNKDRLQRNIRVGGAVNDLRV